MVYFKFTSCFIKVIGQNKLVISKGCPYNAFDSLAKEPAGSSGIAVPDHPPAVKVS